MTQFPYSNDDFDQNDLEVIHTDFPLLNDTQIMNQRPIIENYYNIEENPGVRVETPQHIDKYAYLDRDEVKQKMYEFQEGNLVKVRFFIPSIHCASCIWLLEQLTRLHKGIRHSSVNFIKKELTVNFQDDEITLRELVELLVSIHYIPDISLQSLDNKDNNKTNKKLLYKIGVAGFVFGNVMLYSLPEYFNGQAINESVGSFLYYLCYVLTVPIVFYS